MRIAPYRTAAAWTTAAIGLASSVSAQDAPATEAPTFDPQEIRAVLARQDMAFEHESKPEFFAHFAPLHRPAFVHLAMLVEQAWDREGSIQRTTSLVETMSRGPDRALAYVRSDYTCPSHETKSQGYVLLLGRGPKAGSPKILAQLQFDARMVGDGYGSKVFRCKGCNYSMEASEEHWVMVPQPARVFGSLESIGIYSLWHDLSIQVAVHADDRSARGAAVLLSDWLDDMQRSQPRVFARRAEVEAWLPPGVAEIEGLADVSGARVEVSYGADVFGGERRASVFHVLEFGGLHYMFDIEGSEKALAAAGADAADVLGSFQVLDQELAREGLSRHAKSMMAKGKLEIRRFDNVLAGVSFEAPDGWLGRQPANSDRYDVEFRAPDSSAHVRMRGFTLADRTGLDALVDRLLDGQRTLGDVDDSGWREATEKDPGLGGAKADELEKFEVRALDGACGAGRFALFLVRRVEHRDSVLLEARASDAADLAAALRALAGAKLH